MPRTREPQTEPIPGYRLLEPLGRGGFGEVWKCEAPGGFFKAIKFVEGDNHLVAGHAPANAELTAIQHIKSIRHPFLLSMERVELIDGDLVIVMELADKNLLDLFNEHRLAGQPGVPRDELLHYLREAADVLDLLNLQHDLQHLDIKPVNLFLVSGHVKVADFGLVRNLAGRTSEAKGSTEALSAISPRYGAPELFRGFISPCCDQYSLAIVFQEMLTSSFPFNGKNPRQLAMEHTAGEPNLAPLSEPDRKVIARALAKNPKERFANCRELIDTLTASSGPLPQNPVTGYDGPAVGVDTGNDMGITATVPVRPVSAKYLPDYNFTNCLARSPNNEAWEASTPQGPKQLVKFLYGVTGRDPRREEEAFARLQAISHTVLPALTLVPGGPGCLIAITDLIEGNIRDRFQECRARGAKGLPRHRLAAWLMTAAKALDELSAQYGIQHQSLTPRSLLLDGDELRISDFGFHALVWGPAGQVPTHLQGGYAAPEFSEPEPLRSDQYSLAVIYQEMLTGVHPLRGRNLTSPNLNPLSNAERVVVAKALDINPEARFASSVEFFRALEEARPGGRSAATLLQATSAEDKQVKVVLAQLLADSTNFVPASEPETWLTSADGQTTLQCRFAASLPPVGAHSRFDAFRARWGAQVLCTDDTTLILSVGRAKRIWQRLLGQPGGITIEIQWNTPRPPQSIIPEVLVRIRSTSGKGSEERTFRETAPLLLDSLRNDLQGHSEQRGQERLLWAHPVEVSFQRDDGTFAEPISCQAKDISLTGMGLFLPSATAGSSLCVKLTTPSHPEPVCLPGACVRVTRCGEGWYEAGVLFQ